MKDVPHDSSHSADYTIVAIGESTTDPRPSFNANRDWPSLLEKKLNTLKFSNKKFKVINLGLSAVNSHYYVQNFDRIKEYHPQLIISMIGINDREMIIDKNEKTSLLSFFSKTKIAQSLYWFHQYYKSEKLKNEKLKAQYFQSKRAILQEEFFDYLATIPSHHLDYLDDFQFKQSTKDLFKDYEFEEWITFDIMAEVLGKISLSKGQKGVFQTHHEYLLNEENFYKTASIYFIKKLISFDHVGLESPWIFTQLVEVAKSDFDFILNFYQSNYEKIYLPESSSAIHTAIFFPKNHLQNFLYGYEVLKNNYLKLKELSMKNNIILLPMQYPKLSPQWISKLFHQNLPKISPGIFMCSDPYPTILPSEQMVISNENIRSFCPNFAKDCFFDQFHQCNTEIDYNFGHAGEKLNEIIAENAANFIKSNWNKLEK